MFGAGALKLFYGNRTGRFFSHFISRIPLVSFLYGWWQKLPVTAKNVVPFVEAYGVDRTEFLEPVENFKSFNDFFIRKLKHGSRPLPEGDVAVIPADGRFRFFQNVDESEGFVVKGEKFKLEELLQDPELAEKYRGGAMLIGRLCPTDYHRFHFPVDCIPSESRLINGYLYSVNPIALRQDIDIFTKNKRMITTLESQKFGKVLYIEIGATNVGSIIQTFQPNRPYQKGDEKGYFSFGASALVVLFEPGKIIFEPDLLKQSELEMKCKMGSSLSKL